MNYIYSNNHYVNNIDFLDCLKKWQIYKFRQDKVDILTDAIYNCQCRIDELKSKCDVNVSKVKKLITEKEISIEQYDIRLKELKFSPREKREYNNLYNKLGEIILKLIDHIATKHNYRMYPYLDDMKMLAMEHCISGLDKFNVEQFNNPFWFFSRSVENAFKQVIIKEKKLLGNKFEYVKRHASNDKMLMYDYNIGSEINDDINDYINEMENEIMDEDSDVYSNFNKKDITDKNDLAP